MTNMQQPEGRPTPPSTDANLSPEMRKFRSEKRDNDIKLFGKPREELTASDCYFCVETYSPGMMGVWVCPKKFYDENGRIHDSSVLRKQVIPAGFAEESAANYGPNGDIEISTEADCIKHFKDAGFTHKPDMV